MIRRRHAHEVSVASLCICMFFPFMVLSSLVVDLSYQPRLKAETLANAIGDVVWKSHDKESATVEVDVSSSLVGDDGIEKIVNLLFPRDRKREKDAHEMTVHLAARMNRLTPLGVTRILQAVTPTTVAEKDDVAENNSTATDVESEVWYLHSLDLGWNDLNPEASGSKPFLTALKTLLQDPERCPQIIRLDQCGLSPASCRAIGKGIMNRLSDKANHARHKPLSLHLCGNEAVGDAGVAALAAALRTSTLDNSDGETSVFDVLDLSSCGVGDAGAEALAMALESSPCCIRQLDLSNNLISDEGAAALANALTKSRSLVYSLERLDMSNNKDIADRGAGALSGVMERGKLKQLSLRSCHVRADGAKAFGQALQGLSPFLGNKHADNSIRRVDLSGNPLGVLRGKTKDGGKYSATRLKSKASATASSYMSLIGKNIRSGLKDVGLDVGSSSVESDDDEEERMGMNSDTSDFDPSKARCGAKSFASEVFNVVEKLKGNDSPPQINNEEAGTVRCELAMRHCFLDTGGADALAAAVTHVKEQLGITLVVDVRMNNVLESEMVEALRGEDCSTLEEMADRHLEAMETLRIAEERAAEAASAASSRAPRDDWDDDQEDDMFSFDPYDKDYDSDAIYDDNGEY